MISYRFKKPPEKERGEFECPYCKKIYFTKTSLSGHIGGAHRRHITLKTRRPFCKFCDAELVEGKNWPKWAIKQKNLICAKCKRKQNRDCYHRKKRIRAKNIEAWQHRLKKIAENKILREKGLL